MFQLACRFFKYSFFLVFGFTIACLISIIFGELGLVTMLFNALAHWLWRLTMLAIFCLAGASVLESLR